MEQNDKYIVSKMSTVIVIPVDGIDLSSEKEQNKINQKVENFVKEIINKLKISHAKFEDPDFGPTEKDEFGALSLYGNEAPNPAGSKYPAPSSLKWERPQYDDGKFGLSGGDDDEGEDADEGGDEFEDDFGGFGGSSAEEEIWCKHGKLFLDGSSSADVIQGQLGDCWFLSALAVMGANESLLDSCFWKGDSFREHGLFVLRFYKDCSVIFVVVDDRIPVKAKDGRVIFAGNKDPNELWVPLIEKGYAKLHGCYKALIGGFTHYGLADMTGFCPRLIVMREGYLGYSERYEPDDVWSMLVRYRKWNCLMGCSIQSNPQEKAKVEADAGNGLHMGHAYSLLDVGEINLKGNKTERLVKVRNPWGRGEWEGAYGDRSTERTDNEAEIDRVFNQSVAKQEQVDVNFNDGTFFMRFEDWMKHYTSLFVALNFPKTWTGKRTQGAWKGDSGGNREMSSWMNNPKIKLRIDRDAADKSANADYKQVFVGIYIKDSRLTMGFDYYKDPLYATALAFDIVSAEDLMQTDPKARANVSLGLRDPAKPKSVVKQPPYNFGTTQVEVWLKVDTDYYIVPSLYKRGQAGTFFLNVYVEAPAFHLEGSKALSGGGQEQKPMIVGSESKGNATTLKMSVAQFYEKKELIRERIVSEAKRLNLSVSQIEKLFTDVTDKKALTRGAFKRRMMDLGFALADFPDDDLVILDLDNDGTISPQEFMTFFKDGLAFAEASAPPSVVAAVVEPVDDLLFKAVDLEGELTVSVSGARYLREATTWFNCAAISDGAKKLDAATPGADKAADTSVTAVPAAAAGPVGPAARRYIKYDSAEAAKTNEAFAKERAEQLKQFLAKKARKEAAQAASGKVGLGADTPDKKDGLGVRRDLDEEEDALGESFDAFSPLKSAVKRPPHKGGALTAGNLKSLDHGGQTATHHDGFSVASGMSVTRKEATAKAGMEAAAKLHCDPLLQKAEINRTKSLGALRGHKTNKATLETGVDGGGKSTASGVADDSVLRKKCKPVDKKLRRDITKDPDSMAFLNYRPTPLAGGVDRNGVGVRPSAPFDANQTVLLGANPNLLKMALATQSNTLVADSEVASLTQSTPGKNKLRSQNTMRSILVNDAASAKEVMAAAPVLPSSSRYREVVGDLWDYLLDCVVTISTSRPRNRTTDMNNALLGFKRRHITADSFTIFDGIKSPLPGPSTANLPTKANKGNAPTPKNARKTPGTASVTTMQAQSKQKSAVLEAKDRLKKVEEEQRASYEEVFRRLLLVPTTTAAEIEGDASQAAAQLLPDSTVYLKSLFRKFDRNLNGSISKDEFRLAMNELHIEVSAEDCNIFFNRFGKALSSDGTAAGAGASSKSESHDIDWTEFLNFFQTNVLGATNTTASSASSGSNLITVLITIKKQLAADVQNMTAARVSSLESYLQTRPTAVKGSKIEASSSTAAVNPPPVPATASSSAAKSLFVLPDNAILQDLSLGQAKANSEVLRRLGVTASEEEVGRVSRVFNYSVGQLMAFIRLPSTVDLHAALDLTDAELAKGIALRSGLSTATGTTDQTSSVAKLWTGIAPNLDSMVPYDDIAAYLANMLKDGLNMAAGAGGTKQGVSPRSPVAAATDERKPVVVVNSGSAQILNINADTLCRIVTDTLIYSTWNRRPVAKPGTETKLLSALSFSGLDAYVRNERMNTIDRKLKYLMQLEANFSSPATYLLVHAYLSRAQDELVVLAHDTVSGEVYKLNIRENLAALPSGEGLRKLFPRSLKQDEELAAKISSTLGGALGGCLFNPDSMLLYNPWDTPAEDAAVSEFLSRLKIVRGRSAASSLIVAEEQRFTAQLKGLLDAASLPFFSILNDLTLSFSVDEQAIHKKSATTSSIRSLVFGALRSQKTLHTFMVNVSSSLNVVLSTYNNDAKEAFKWTEMLAHLTNYRSPFITVQLLPRFVEPEEYIYVPTDDTAPFTGEEPDDPLAIQRGPVDVDGAPHPVWNSQFKFKFRPPRLTSCKVLCTEIAKMRIDDVTKYVIVMVRESKRTLQNTSKTIEKVPFRFLTIYDPRTATEYQCGVQEGCELHKMLFSRIKELCDFGEFMGAVSEATDTSKLILGPAITPRVVVNVFNQNGPTAEEQLGSCQVSISSVLSGSGVGEKQWVTMTYALDGSSGAPGTKGRSVVAKAGDIELELGFRKQAEIDAQRESEEKHQKRLLAQAEAAEVAKDGANKSKTGGGAVSAESSSSSSKKQSKEREAELRDLAAKHETLVGEYNKLRGKVSSAVAPSVPDKDKDVSPRAAAVVAAAPDEKLLEELKAAKEATARLQAEKVAAEQQRLKSEAEVKTLKEALAKQQQQQQQQNARAPAASTADAELAESHRKLVEEHRALLAEAEKLRAAMQSKKSNPSEYISAASGPPTAADDRPIGGKNQQSSTADALPVAKLQIAAPSAVGGGHIDASEGVLGSSDFARVEDDPLLGTATAAIVKLIVARHEGRGAHGNPLDSLQRLLMSYSKGDGQTTAKDVTTALADLLIEVSTEQCVKMMRAAGLSLKASTVPVSSVMDLFRGELTAIQATAAKRKPSSKPAQGGEDSRSAPSPSRTSVLGEIHTAKYKPLKAKDGSEGDASAAAAAIVRIIVSRHDKRGTHGNPLDSLQRLLTSYSKGDGQVGAKDLANALGDLLVDMTSEDCAKIMQAAGAPAKSATVPVVDLMDLFRAELAAVQSSAAATKKPISGKAAGRTGAMTPITSTDDAGGAPSLSRTSTAAGEGFNTAKDKPSKARPSTAGRQQPQKEDTQSPAAGPETLGSLRSKSASNVKKDPAPAPPVAAPAVIDWFSVELPPGWERRVHNANGKILYLHHESKQTQWHHPLDTAPAKKKRREGGDRSSAQQLNKTVDAAASRRNDGEGPASSNAALSQTYPAPKSSSTASKETSPRTDANYEEAADEDM